MNKEELLKSITDIGTCEDVNIQREMLSTLTENVTKVFDEYDLLQEGTKTLEEKLKTKEEELKVSNEYNMKMFLKLQSEKEESFMERETGIKEEPKKEYKSFNELGKNYL